jgi:hypothetical protein
MFFLIPIAFALATGALIETRWQFPRDVQISSHSSRPVPAYSRVMHPDWPPPPYVPSTTR